MSDTPVFARVTVLGAGTMGSGIAQICAQAGSEVCLYDVNQELVDRGYSSLMSFLDRGVAKGKMTADESAQVLQRIHPTVDLESALGDVNLVIEAIPEDLELKRQTFATVTEHVSDTTVLATNTSSLPLAKIFEGIENPGRCIGTHFFNPPPLMPLLEIIHSAESTPVTLDKILEYGRQLGKDPIIVRDSPGFATSRLGVVLGLEAIRMVESGVAEPADIDKAMELGYRHPMGPLRLTDLVGLDVRMAIAGYLRQELDSPAFEVPKLMRDMVERGETGKKAGRGFYEWSE